MKQTKQNVTKRCKSAEEQYTFLTEELGLSDADISAQASLMIGVYAEKDVIEPTQAEYDAMIAALEVIRQSH